MQQRAWCLSLTKKWIRVFESTRNSLWEEYRTESRCKENISKNICNTLQICTILPETISGTFCLQCTSTQGKKSMMSLGIWKYYWVYFIVIFFTITSESPYACVPTMSKFYQVWNKVWLLKICIMKIIPLDIMSHYTWHRNHILYLQTGSNLKTHELK